MYSQCVLRCLDMATKRYVLDFDDKDVAVLKQVSKIAEAKYGAKTFTSVIRAIMREYVAANEPKQEPK